METWEELRDIKSQLPRKVMDHYKALFPEDWIKHGRHRFRNHMDQKTFSPLIQRNLKLMLKT